MIYDIIVIAIIIISVIIGFRRGAAKSVVTLIGSFASLLVAVFLGEYLAELIYDSYLRQAIIDGVTTSVENGSKDVIGSGVLPAFVSFVLNLTGFDTSPFFESAAESVPTAIALGFEASAGTVVISVLSLLLTLIINIVVYFIFRKLVLRLLLAIFKLPVIRLLNKLLGVVFSLISALLIISFIAFLFKLVMPYITDMPFILSESTIYNSYIFYHFYSGNIFYALISLW